MPFLMFVVYGCAAHDSLELPRKIAAVGKPGFIGSIRYLGIVFPDHLCSPGNTESDEVIHRGIAHGSPECSGKRAQRHVCD